MTLIDLLEKVRIKGRVNLKGKLDENLPIVITTNDGETPYFNSGGRSIIFEYDDNCYRLKGVDPYGFLTEKVVVSKRNRLSDVKIAYNQIKKHSKEKNLPLYFSPTGKPFGVLTKEDAERERIAFEILSKEYEKLGVSKPCEYVGTYRVLDGFVQNLYKIQSLDSDLRLEEFDQLMRERLNKCDEKELESKAKQIFKLYGRFLFWLGWNIRLLASNKLEPHPMSWVSQNFVISKVKDGYGVFRVDHTSTMLKENEDREKLIEKILSNSGIGGPEEPTFGSYVHVPTSILIALNYEFTTGKKPEKKIPLFEQGFKYRGIVKSWKRGYGYFMNLFALSFVGGINSSRPPFPIPEDMIREALA